MFTHPTDEKLRELNLAGMAKALAEQRQSDIYDSMSFEERFALLVDREATERDNRRLGRRIQGAKLREDACIEDLNFKLRRNLDRSVIQQLSTSQWVRKAYNVFITGATGVGKTFLACALTQKACRDGFDSLYLRTPLLFQDLALAKADGRYRKLLASLAKKRLLALDDWGLAPLSDEQRRDLLEIVEDRHGRAALIIVSQVPVEKWHQSIGDPTLADAILDRIVHCAIRIDMTGDTVRPHYFKVKYEKGDE